MRSQASNVHADPWDLQLPSPTPMAAANGYARESVWFETMRFPIRKTFFNRSSGEY